MDNIYVTKIKTNTMLNKINFIKNYYKNTHSEKDFEDLLTFSEEEIEEIYSEIFENLTTKQIKELINNNLCTNQDVVNYYNNEWWDQE